MADQLAGSVTCWSSTRHEAAPVQAQQHTRPQKDHQPPGGEVPTRVPTLAVQLSSSSVQWGGKLCRRLCPCSQGRAGQTLRLQQTS